MAAPPAGGAAGQRQALDQGLPVVRVPLRVKIASPYAFLALVFAIATAYVVSQVVIDSAQERYTNQLIETGKLAADWNAGQEGRLLETLRFIANTQGLAEAVANRDSGRLEELALPVALNAQAQAVEILDASGASLLSLRQRPEAQDIGLQVFQAEEGFAQWDFVRRVLAQEVDQRGDKYAGLGRTAWGDYLFVAGPVYDNQGRLVGAALVGKSLEALARQLRQDLLAQATIYDLTGQPLASSFPEGGGTPLAADLAAKALAQGEQASLLRDVRPAEVMYGEIIGPLQARGEDIGLIGVALPQAFLVHTGQVTRMQVFILVAVAILLVVGVGVYLADRITHPLASMVSASSQVAQGNLGVRIRTDGNDEVSVLAHAFNYMVAGLQEGVVYRDLLGRTVSPEVRDRLRRAFASGEVRLEGQETTASVLIIDIRNFTRLAEKASPTVVLAWLNEYFGELLPVITAWGGVVNEFAGDSFLAFFGILPQPLPAQESSYQACQAALELLRMVEQYNARRAERGDPPFITGVGVNTGVVTAGSLGTPDRLQYTLIGDTVNTTQRLEDMTREFGESAIVVSQHTLLALGARQDEFRFEPLGEHIFKGKLEPVLAYRLRPLEAGGERRDERQS